MRSRLVALVVAIAACLVVAAPAGAFPRSHGQLLHLAPRARANTNQSNNWFGYNQGAVEKGDTLFSSITGDWVVPTASQHSGGGDQSSSTWIGIGGGCVDANCVVGDNTLIQTGTEQDVSGGKASYSAWWEIIPAPSITITNMTVSPGDQMHADITEVAPLSNVWTIKLQDLTNGQSFSQTVPYTSTHATAEWIEETPLLIGTNAGLAALPNLTTTPFDLGTVNGATAGLISSEEMQLIDSNGNVIGAPSAPDSDADGFNVCAWATSCAPPQTS
jgi:hypothetical protein